MKILGTHAIASVIGVQHQRREPARGAETSRGLTTYHFYNGSLWAEDGTRHNHRLDAKFYLAADAEAALRLSEFHRLQELRTSTAMAAENATLRARAEAAEAALSTANSERRTFEVMLPPLHAKIAELKAALSERTRERDAEIEAAFKDGYHCRWHRDTLHYTFDPALAPGDPDGAFAARQAALSEPRRD